LKVPHWLGLLCMGTFIVLLVQLGSFITTDEESKFFYLSYQRKTPSEAFLSGEIKNIKPTNPRDLASVTSRSRKTQNSSQELTFPRTDCDHLYSFICEQEQKLSDPTGSLDISTVASQAAKNLLDEIKKRHPKLTPAEVQEKLAETIFNSKNQARIQKAFTWVKRELILFFEQQSDSIFTAAEKSRIQDLILKTRLKLPPPASVYADQLDLLTSDEVYYEKTEQGERLLRVGGGYILTSQSWFNLIFTFAHELAHAIDICEIKDEGLSFPAFDHLNACFLEHGLIDLHHERKECIAHDHLAEVFADWIAVQITSLSLKTFAQEYPKLPLENAIRNSVRDLCTPTHHERKDPHQNPEEFEFHPLPKIRVEMLFSHHPTIRALLGCGALKIPQASFCSFEKPLTSIKPPLPQPHSSHPL